MSEMLAIQQLRVELPSADGWRAVVADATLRIGSGEAVGLVGESGSGKSMCARAAMRILPDRARVTGTITFDGESVLDMGARRLRSYCGEEVAMIFQDPSVHLNPIRTVGDFLTEALRDRGVAKHVAYERAGSLLSQVLIADPARVLSSYPHQLSGGMQQRVMIAGALAGEPRLLLADEPTTALDVTTQAEVLAIVDRLRRERGLAMLFISHDLELAAAVCDRTVVMYAGRTVEEQPSTALHRDPVHPYTVGLLASRPHIAARQPRLDVLPGRPLAAYEAPPGCPFAPRCAHVQDACREQVPPLQEFGDGAVACRRAAELHPSRVTERVDA